MCALNPYVALYACVLKWNSVALFMHVTKFLSMSDWWHVLHKSFLWASNKIIAMQQLFTVTFFNLDIIYTATLEKVTTPQHSCMVQLYLCTYFMYRNKTHC